MPGTLEEEGFAYEEEEEEDDKFEDDTEMRMLFNAADEDMSGYLEKSEVMLLVVQFYPSASPSECNKLLQASDTNGDGKLSFRETKRLIKALMTLLEDEGDDDS